MRRMTKGVGGGDDDDSCWEGDTEYGGQDLKRP